PLTALEAFAALSELRPANAILVNETASNFADLAQYWPINEPGTYYTFASGGLGWGEPAAVGVAIAQKKLGTGRPVVAAIGDGSLQYCVQSLYTAAQEKLKLIYIVPCNDEYAILKEFAVLEKTPNVPALDLPGLDVVATAKAFGCAGVAANTTDQGGFQNGSHRRRAHRDCYPHRASTQAADIRRGLVSGIRVHIRRPLNRRCRTFCYG
ncbi:MAG: thiamine pyrophosphate-dependent enzyme, partial [Xanthobacteraceae bacterium]